MYQGLVKLRYLFVLTIKIDKYRIKMQKIINKKILNKIKKSL